MSKCIKCGKVLKYSGNKWCGDCYAKYGRFKENNPRWKGGKPKCQRCGKVLSDYKGTFCRKCSILGKNNPNWKGGKKIHNGYIMLRKPFHPNADSHGYIFEHRYVMSEILGRKLESKEVVHHKNGNKKDNRRKNLQLRTTSNHHHLHKGNYKKVDKNIIKEMIKKYLNGKSSIQIGKEYNITARTVLYWLKANSIKVRTSGETQKLQFKLSL